MCPEYFISDLTPLRDELLSELKKLRKELLEEEENKEQEKKDDIISCKTLGTET